MTSEDSKQADPELTSPGSQEQQQCNSDASVATSNQEHAARPGAQSSPEIVIDERWDDSEIEAAIGVLERPSQIPLSAHGPIGNASETEELAPLLERPSVTLSASSVEKSKRGGSDPPISTDSTSKSSNAPSAVTNSVETGEVQSVAFVEASSTEPNRGRDSVTSADDSDKEEVTRYYDRVLAESTATPSPSPETQPSATSVVRAPLASPSAKPSSAQDEVEEATQFYAGSSVSLPAFALDAEAEEAMRFIERPNSSPPIGGHDATQSSEGKPLGGAAPSSAGETGPSFTPFAIDRPSSEALATGVALLSAETTDPPPVVAKDGNFDLKTRSSDRPVKATVHDSTNVPRPKPLPPRPDPTRKPHRSVQVAPDLAPLSVPSGEIPTRLVIEGGVSPPPTSPSSDRANSASATLQNHGSGAPLSGDSEPMSERSNEAPGGEIDVPAQGLTGVTAFSIAPRPGSAGFEEEAWLDPIAVRAARRLLRVAASAVVAGLLLSPIDAWYARRAAADHPSLWQLTLACAGLLTPLVLLLSIAVTGLSVILHPDSAPSLHRLPQKLRPLDIRRQARLAVILIVAPLATCCWIFLVARAALPLLGSKAPASVVGTLLAAMSIGLGLLVAAPVLAVARYVGVRLRQNPPDPVRWGLIGALVGILPLVIAIATGATSGAGSVFAIFGVFKRPELDLRAPLMLLVIALAGYLLPSRISGLRLAWLFPIALLPLGLTYRAGARGLDSRAIALAVERGAPLSRVALGAARRASDRDHDGYSGYFGGGDCDDRNRYRNPGVDDVPGNGVDEDCSGSDASAVNSRLVAATPLELLRERRTSIPEDLNLILIVVDTMRADALNHAKHVTPRLDELAGKAVIVQNAYAPASYTGRSVGPLLIGKHSSETNRDFSHFAVFSKKDTFVQQRLHSAGIRTVSVQGYWYFYQSIYGFDRGFDVVDSSAATGTGYVEGDRTTTSEKLTDRVLQQLEHAENTTGRFFLWAQYTDPHYEYVSHPGFDLGSDALGKYHGEVAFVDYHIGRIIDLVRSKPWGARTAIVVTSDHGEAFGEHGMIRHGFELWEPLVRVPLVFHVPGIQPRQVRSRRSLIDLVPTILDLMQVVIPEGSGTDFVSGRSLLPELLGIDGSDQPRPLLVDMAQGPFSAERQAYIDGDLKLATSQGSPIGLFDLSSDPAERRDLLDNAVLRDRVVGEYRAYRKAMQIVYVQPKPRAPAKGQD